MIRLALVSMLMTLSAAVVSAQSFDDYMSQALMGDAESQFVVGICYLEGDGVERNVEVGERWLIEATNSSNPKWKIALGEMYYYGDLLEQNYEEALKWYLAAMKSEDVEAARLVANMFYDGKGVECPDRELAVDIWRSAADRGDTESMYNLFSAMFADVGVTFEEGMDNLRKAASNWHLQSQFELGAAYEYGYMVEQDYDLAIYWYSLASHKGYARAQRALGLMYFNGLGVDVQLDMAVELFTEAAKQGDAEAQFYLGECYYYGNGVEQNIDEAYVWLRKAMEQEYTPALDYFG